MRQNYIKLLLTIGLAFFGFLWAGSALANCDNGYCQNSSSPVIGGWTQVNTSSIHGFRPFGNIGIPSGATSIGNGSYYNAWPHCPANTAMIEVPFGYKATNGTMYNWTEGHNHSCYSTGYGTFCTNSNNKYGDNGGSVHTEVCVKTDTF